MSKQTKTEERTHTLDELVGDMPEWWHYFHAGDAVAICGHVLSGRASLPFGHGGGGPDCPDCARIHRETGGRW